MTREAFMQDLERIYGDLQRRTAELHRYFELTQGKRNPEARRLVERFARELEEPLDEELTLAALTRIVSLREDALEQVLRRRGADEEEVIEKKERAYLFVGDFYRRRFEELIAWIEEEELLTPFYRTLIYGVHSVGLAMSRWQVRWSAHIIHGVNRELFELFNGDEEKIFEMLRAKELLDRRGEEEADRSYSVLVSGRDGYRRVAYAEAFAKEVAEVGAALGALISQLLILDDELFGQKEQWIVYLRRLKQAMEHTRPDELVEYWAEVDRAWMKVTAPLQIGHPLEYYEDHYRKAVALEWDLRIVNPSLQRSSRVRDAIKNFAADLAVELGLRAQKLYLKNLEQIDRTQLYIGRPMLFYGAEFNGLFSAQVVPNDEKVSAQEGKKIFAYADYVRESLLARPVMQLAVETLGIDRIRAQRRRAAREPELWYRLYDIETVGHEFGHILWIDSDTETAMNAKGQFKNIEEFKATAGGLMAFFHREDPALRVPLLEDTVSRAVGLMAWREVGEVLPYYCEGLIHLELLYAAGAIRFDGIRVEVYPEAYDAVRAEYVEAYRNLARHYLEHRDAAEYLGRYATKEEGHYLPLTREVREFVRAYYARYKQIGQQVAREYAPE